MKKILKKLKTDFKFLTGYSYKGLIEALSMGFASMLYSYESKLEYIKKQSFIETADKDYLYIRTGYLLEPKTATHSNGYVIFYGSLNSIIPKGTIIQDEENNFTTINEGIIADIQFTSEVVSIVNGIVNLPSNLNIPSCDCTANGHPIFGTSTETEFSFPSADFKKGEIVTIRIRMSNEIEIESEIAGANTNKNFNDIVKTKIKIEGIKIEGRVLVLIGGTDDEETESYRKRVKHYIANPIAPFNENNIKSTIFENVPSIKYIFIKGGAYRSGRITIYAVNENFSLLEGEKEKILECVFKIKPSQMRPNFIKIFPSAVRIQNVIIKDLLPSNEKLKEEITKSIIYLFDADLFEKGISKEKIQSIIYRTRYGIQEIESFTIEQGPCSKIENTIYKLGKVTFI